MHPTYDRIRILGAAALLGLALASPAQAGWSSSPYKPTPVCTNSATQYASSGCSDGAGGLFVVWQDYRSGAADIYAQHLDAHGNATWTFNGVPVCTAANDQQYPVACTDGTGGCYIAWSDYRFDPAKAAAFVVRLTSGGAVASGWTSNGTQVIGNAMNPQHPIIVADDKGGAHVAYDAVYSGTDSDPVRVRVFANGSVSGPYVGTSDTHLQHVNAVVAHNGGVYLLWTDLRNASHYVLYAQFWNDGGNAMLPSGGLALCSNGSADIRNAFAVGDGTGGLMYTCDDGTELWVGRLNSDLVVAFNGVYGFTSSGITAIGAVPDGYGGILSFWEDHRSGSTEIWSSRVLPNHEVAPGWHVGGNKIYGPVTAGWNRVASDSTGGAIFGFYANPWLSLGHIDGNLASWPTWPADGRLVGGISNLYTLSSDGAQGALVTMDVPANGTTTDICAQRVERFSQLGDPGPAITGVKDVKNDQGGQMKVSWTASSLDVQPSPLVTAYEIWRSVPAAYAALALRDGTRLLGAGAARPATPGRVLAREPSATGAIYWEYVGQQPATTAAGYSFVVPTTGDSIGGSNPYTAVKVRAIGGSTGAFWESWPDSGYSVDNLAPVAPAPFTGTYAPGTGVLLTWGPNAESDLAGYRLYRGTTPGFVPGPANLVAQLATTNYTDAGAAPAYYKLTACDVHGNESAATLALLSGTAGVESDAAPRAVYLAPVAPNPARVACALRFGLPAMAEVELAIFDATGRRVRTLATGEHAAGAYALRWDGLDDAGRPAESGLYFARLRAGERTHVERFTLMR